MTGLSNRRELERCLESWDALGEPYAVILLDIDHFKAINDTYGHQTGDQVLKLVAAVMVDCAPADAVCSRFGGEEFVILLRERSLDTAYRMAERIRRAILISPTPYSGTLTVSIGVSLYPEHGETGRMYFKRRIWRYTGRRGRTQPHGGGGIIGMRETVAALVDRIPFCISECDSEHAPIQIKKLMLDALPIGCYNHHIKIIGWEMR